MAAETDKRSINAASGNGGIGVSSSASEQQPGTSGTTATTTASTSATTKEQSPIGNQQQQQQPITNGNVEERITEFQKNIASTIAPGVKRKAVVLERPNIGALFSSDEINFLVYRYLVENGWLLTFFDIFKTQKPKLLT